MNFIPIIIFSKILVAASASEIDSHPGQARSSYTKFHNILETPQGHNGLFASQLKQGILQSLRTNTNSVSGDYCVEPFFTCNTMTTLLYCIQGRCTCPTQWTLSPGNLPLNTVWHPELKKCVSTRGSGCHIVTSPTTVIPPPAVSTTLRYSIQDRTNQDEHLEDSPAREIASGLIKGLVGLPETSGLGLVYCQPGLQCVRHTGYQEVGVCTASSLKSPTSVLIVLTFVSLMWR